MSKAANNAQQLPSLGEGLGVGSPFTSRPFTYSLTTHLLPLTSPSLNREGRGGSSLHQHLLPVLYVDLTLHGMIYTLAVQVVHWQRTVYG